MSLIQSNDENYMPKWMKEKLEREEKSMEEREKNKKEKSPSKFQKNLEVEAGKTFVETVKEFPKEDTLASKIDTDFDSVKESVEREKEKAEKTAIVVNTMWLNARNTPGGEVSAVLKAETAIKLTGETDGPWTQIILPDGTPAWVKHNYLEIL